MLIVLILFLDVFVCHLNGIYVPIEATHEYYLKRITRKLEQINKGNPVETRLYVQWEGDGTGWGNQVRGLSSSLAIALLTNRTLLIEGHTEPHRAIYFDIFDEPTPLFNINMDNLDMKSIKESITDEEVRVPYRTGLPLSQVESFFEKDL